MKVKYKGLIRELTPPRQISELLEQVHELYQIPSDSDLACFYANSSGVKVPVRSDGDFGLALLEMGHRSCFNFKLLNNHELDQRDSDLALLVGFEWHEDALAAAIDNLSEGTVSEFRRCLLKRCNAPEFNLTAQVLKMIAKIQSKRREATKPTPLLCRQAMSAFFSGKRSKADILKEFEIDNAKFDEWLQIFSKPSETDFTLLCYPEEFAVEVMQDYLKGEYTSTQVTNYFALPLDVLYSWIRQAGDQRVLQPPDSKSLDAVLARSSMESNS